MEFSLFYLLCLCMCIFPLLSMTMIFENLYALCPSKSTFLICDYPWIGRQSLNLSLVRENLTDWNFFVKLVIYCLFFWYFCSIKSLLDPRFAERWQDYPVEWFDPTNRLFYFNLRYFCILNSSVALNFDAVINTHRG